MTTSKEMVLIGGVVRSLRLRGSWTGETHIQKTAYIAKIKRNIPFESEFVLYKHGPYSFDLNKSVGHMLGRGLLSADANAGYGPSYNVNEALWKALNTGLGDIFSRFEEGITSVSNQLARKNVADLERIATAVYMSFNFPTVSFEARANLITKAKPHIPHEVALAALIEADKI